MFKKTLSNGFFKKGSDAGHLGVKALSNPASSSPQSYPPSTNAPKVSGVLQKLK